MGSLFNLIGYDANTTSHGVIDNTGFAGYNIGNVQSERDVKIVSIHFEIVLTRTSFIK
jgi:hypothetical protein